MEAATNSAVNAPEHAFQHEQEQYLTFMLAGDMFAMGILSIKEIIEYGSLTTVPRMPGFIRGVINLRGAVVPVIDLGARFDKTATAVTRRTCIIIVEVSLSEDEKQDVGVMVDAVNEVLEISPSEIEPAPSFGSNVRVDFISGMGKIGDKFVIILDIDRVLSMEEMAALAGVSSTGQQDYAAQRLAA